MNRLASSVNGDGAAQYCHGGQPVDARRKRVCQTLGQCLSIVERHPQDSFDYDLLVIEFARYGSWGQVELLRLPDARANAADLLALSRSPTLIA